MASEIFKHPIYSPADPGFLFRGDSLVRFHNIPSSHDSIRSLGNRKPRPLIIEAGQHLDLVGWFNKGVDAGVLTHVDFIVGLRQDQLIHINENESGIRLSRSS